MRWICCIVVVVVVGWWCGFLCVFSFGGDRSGRLWTRLRLQVWSPPWFPYVLIVVDPGRVRQQVLHGSRDVLVASSQRPPSSFFRYLWEYNSDLVGGLSEVPGAVLYDHVVLRMFWLLWSVVVAGVLLFVPTCKICRAWSF